MPHQINKKCFQRNSDGSCYKQLTSAETCNRLDIFPFSYSFDIVASIVSPIWRLEFHLIFRHRHFPFDKESEVAIWLLRTKRLLRRLCDCKQNPRLPVIDFVHRSENNADWRQFQLMDWIYSEIFRKRLKTSIKTLKADVSVSRCRTDVKNTIFLRSCRNRSSTFKQIRAKWKLASDDTMTLSWYLITAEIQFSVVNCTFAFVICLFSASTTKFRSDHRIRCFVLVIRMCAVLSFRQPETAISASDGCGKVYKDDQRRDPRRFIYIWFQTQTRSRERHVQ